MQKKIITLRIAHELDDRIDAYCKMKHIESRSDFFRLAAVDKITPDISDEVLVFESIKSVHEKVHTLSTQQDIFFSFFCFYFKHFFLYNAELPVDQQEAAALSAKDRYRCAMESFKKEIQSSNSMFESLLADFFEEKP